TGRCTWLPRQESVPAPRRSQGSAYPVAEQQRAADSCAMPSSTVRRESALQPRCARNRRRVPCRSSGNRLSRLHLCDLRSPYCAPFLFFHSRRAILEPPVCAERPVKPQGSFKKTTGIVLRRSIHRFARLLRRRVHAGASVLVAGHLFGFARCRAARLLLGVVAALAFAFSPTAQLPHSRFNFVNKAEMVVIANYRNRRGVQTPLHE